jgi:hypothetical protein
MLGAAASAEGPPPRRHGGFVCVFVFTRCRWLDEDLFFLMPDFDGCRVADFVFVPGGA